MIMTEIPEVVTMQCFFGSSLVCDENNTAESGANADNCDYFPICILSSSCFLCLFLLSLVYSGLFSGSSSLF